MSISNAFAGFIGSLAGIVYSIGSLIGIIWCLKIVFDNFGAIGLAISVFVAPVTLYVVPLYAGLSKGNWIPFLLIYGVAIVAFILSMFMGED